MGATSCGTEAWEGASLVLRDQYLLSFVKFASSV